MDDVIKFKQYTNSEDIPKYKSMDCYFNTPLLMALSERGGWYYILTYRDGNYWIMMHDISLMSCMHGGTILGEKDPSRYQADEYMFETKSEFIKFLQSAGFNEETTDDIKIRIKKLKKYIIKSKKFIKEK